MDYKLAAARIAGIKTVPPVKKRIVSVSRAFKLANSAYRVANLEAEDRLKQDEMFKRMGSETLLNDDWIPAAGGKEEPFTTKDGRKLQYMWNPSTREHAYLDLNTDILLSDDEAWKILGSSIAANVTYESAPEYESIESFVEYKMDDEDNEFDHEDLVALAYRIKSSPGKIRKELEDFGLFLKERPKEKKPRGFQSPNHDR